MPVFRLKKPKIYAVSAGFLFLMVAAGIFGAQMFPESKEGTDGTNSEPVISSSAAPSVIPEADASAAAADRKAQEDAEKAKIGEDQKNAEQLQQQAQAQEAPRQFTCDVHGVRTGANGNVLLVRVQAPSDVPDVWAKVTTSSGIQRGKISMQGGIGEQRVSFRSLSPAERTTIEIYSMPIFEKQYKMCEFG